MKVILFLTILTYSGVVDINNPTVTSGFGDYRLREKYHFHAGIDIGVEYGTKVKYPEGEDQYYDATIVYIKYGHNTWPNQTVSFILGRFDFTHLLDGTNSKDLKYKGPDTTLLRRLKISSEKWASLKTWKSLWNYCSKSENIDTTTGQCIWKGGMQVGYVSRGNRSENNQHLHFGELLIPNKPISSNLLINPLWKFRGTLEFNGGTYQRYGYYEDVSDTRKPVTTAVQNRVDPTYPGYMTPDSVSTGRCRGADTIFAGLKPGIWDSDVWLGKKRNYSSTSGLRSIDLITNWVHYFYDRVPGEDSSYWMEDSVWCQVVGANGHETEVEIVGRPLDHINSNNKIIPFELKGAITPYKIQYRLGYHFDVINENARNFGYPAGGIYSKWPGYEWLAFKFDTISGNRYNDESNVLKFYYRTVNFKRSTTNSGLPDRIGNETYHSNESVFYTDISHNYKTDTHYVNIAASKICGKSYSSVPCAAEGSSYKDYFYPDGIYFFWKIEKDVEGEDSPNTHSESSRCAVIVDNYKPTWFLKIDASPIHRNSAVGIIHGEANEPLTLPRYILTANDTGAPEVRESIIDSFVKIRSVDIVNKGGMVIYNICTNCVIEKLLPGIPSHHDSVFSSSHIEIVTKPYTVPQWVIDLMDSTDTIYYIRMSFKMKGFRDLAENLLNTIDTTVLDTTIIGDRGWYEYYHTPENVNIPQPKFKGSPSKHSNGNSDAVNKTFQRNKQFGILNNIIKVYDSYTGIVGNLDLAHRYAVQTALFSADSLKTDSIIFLGFGFAPTIVSDSVNFFITYSCDSLMINPYDTFIPVVKPVTGKIFLYTLGLISGGDTSNIGPRVIYSNEHNTAHLALGPVASVMTNKFIYVVFEEYWTRYSKGRHIYADGTLLRILRYDPYLDSIVGPFTIDTITEEWGFNTPDDIKRAIDTLKSASLGVVGDSILYIAWAVNRKDTGIFKVYRLNLNDFDTLSEIQQQPVYFRTYPLRYVSNPHLAVHNYEVNVFFSLQESDGWNNLYRWYTQDGSENSEIEELFTLWNVRSYRSDGRAIILSANPYGYADLRYSIYPYDTLYLLRDFYDVAQPGIVWMDTVYYATYIATDGIFGYKPGISLIPVGNSKIEYRILLGGEEKSPYTIYREGHINYDSGNNVLKTLSQKIGNIFKRKSKYDTHTKRLKGTFITRCNTGTHDIHRVDYGDSLIYEIRGISARNYRLYLTGYQKEERRVIEFVTVNDIPMGVLNLKYGKERTIKRWIPKWLVREGRLRIRIKKVRGQKAYLEKIVLKKAGCGKNGIQTEDKKLNFEISMSRNIILQSMPAIIKLSLPQKDRVLIRIYDIQGREVETVVDKVFESGTHLISLNTHKLHSGVYFLQVKSKTYSRKVVKKFMVLK